MSGAAIGDGAGPVAASGAGSRLAPITRQAGFFAGIGLVSSVANAALYLLLRQWWDAETATVVAVTVTTLISTEANRRMTFAEARWTSRAGLIVQNLVVILFYCTYNTATLWVLHQIATAPSAGTESLALLIASTAGGTARFVLLRAWVFRGRGAPATQTTRTQTTAGAVAAHPTTQPATPVDDLIGREQDDGEQRSRIEALARRCRPHHSAHH